MPSNNNIHISIILFGFSIEAIQSTVDAILQQSSTTWELMLVVDDEKLLGLYAKNKRVNTYVHRQGVLSNINLLLDKALGSFIIFLYSGDLLSRHFVDKVTSFCKTYNSTKLLYVDESNRGEKEELCFKPDWNPDYLYSFNYFSRGVLYSRELLLQLDDLPLEIDSFHYALALKAIALLKQSQISHISEVLLCLATTDTRSNNSDLKLFEKIHQKIHINTPFNIDTGITNNTIRVKFGLAKPEPLVSIIIPTKDHLELLKVCVDDVLYKTEYKNIEILIIDNNSAMPETLAYLKSVKNNPKIEVIPYKKAFNFSAMMNLGVAKARGEFIALLNNDISVINKEWLTEMVSQANRPEIGCVGAKLFYPDGTIQHAGVILGLKGYASHAHKGCNASSSGYFNRLVVVHNVSAVTAACLVVRKNIFNEVKGFDAKKLKVAYNDVDFCLKVREAGYRNLFTPYAQLIHHESKSRGKKRSFWQQRQLRAESRFLRKKWGDLLFSDPAYNKNLTLLREDFSPKDECEK